MTVSEAERLVRATTHPYPGAYVVDGDRVCRSWQGEVADPSRRPEATARRFSFSNGVYDALVWAIE